MTRPQGTLMRKPFRAPRREACDGAVRASMFQRLPLRRPAATAVHKLTGQETNEG
jgi:hypothetical protein